MSDTLQGPIVDWAPFVLDAEGNLATQALVNASLPFDTVTDAASFTAASDQMFAEARNILTPAAFGALQEITAYLQDLAAEDIVPYGEESAFFLHLEYAKNVPDIPTTGNIAAFLTPYVQEWAASRGYNPGPNYVAPPPPVLPNPSLGQQSVAKSAQAITPSTITPGLPQGVSPEAVSAALAVTAVDVLWVVAHVIDDMLPNMAPGQVPQALSQLNQAATVLERQMAGVLSDVDVNVKGSMAAELNGALEALHGLSQEVNTLAEQMATKADSGILDDVNTNTAQIALVSGAVTALAGEVTNTVMPELDSLNVDVGELDTTVNDQIKPELAQVTEQTTANTLELSGTDKECLDQLCDAINNVSNPIKEGGATPGLLKGLGNLLTKGIELGILATIVDALVTVADAPVALSAVVQDTELMSKWATSAANVITTDYSWLGPLPHG